MVIEVTLTLMLQELFAAIVPPFRLNEVPATTALTTPGPQPVSTALAGLAIVTPVGRLLFSNTPVSGLAFKLLS